MDHNNPWKTLSSKAIYDNPWISVREDQVINPAGGEGIYGVVSFKTRSVTVIPVDDAGNTWLVGQTRYALNEYSWELPMGGSPLGEDLEACARRELKEETGLVAGRLQLLMKMHTSNSVTNEEGYVYLAQQLSQQETEHEDTEDITVRKLPLREAIDMAMSGDITDAQCVAALLRLRVMGLG
ncbi:NUDIX domain-containing protein [Marinobacterium jannaschii]|uniref:NUDIX domain-containing protein n=1 Tax=Marinobacterium jannaschii TaxID=64970 RepID=UPI0004874A6A|nr:NUDIX hydrolase [Marinobacterium jannaschii]